MQRAIIAGLKPAMAARRDGILGYPGRGWNDKAVRMGGRDVALDDDEYDLRAVLRFLAFGKSAIYGPGPYVEETFRTSFSRAAHGLEERGILIDTGQSLALRIVRLAPDAPSFDHPWVAQARRVLEARNKARRREGAAMMAAMNISLPPPCGRTHPQRAHR